MTNWREPIEFTAGDTLLFTRSLDDYPADQGWNLTYELRGGSQPIEFTSTASGSDHSVAVLPAVTALWLAGVYVMEGFAILASTGERHRIYYGKLTISPNLQGSSGDVDVKTFKQKALECAEKNYLKSLEHNILESDIEGTKIVRQKQQLAYEAYARAYQDRQNEIAGERGKAGLPTGQKIKPRFNITLQGRFPWQGGGVIGTLG